jgi:hypothetical protein
MRIAASEVTLLANERWRPSNKRMKLTSALASAPRDTEEGHFACSPFGEHRALAAYPRCYTDTSE